MAWWRLVYATRVYGLATFYQAIQYRLPIVSVVYKLHQSIRYRTDASRRITRVRMNDRARKIVGAGNPVFCHFSINIAWKFQVSLDLGHFTRPLFPSLFKFIYIFPATNVHSGLSLTFFPNCGGLLFSRTGFFSQLQ